MEKDRIQVLFVCLGNICRSPLAEALFKDKVEKKNLAKRIVADSCGTSNYHIGDPPDERTIANAAKNGITIRHRGRQLHASDLEKFDLIVAMDSSNLRNIMSLPNAASFNNKIHMMRNFDPDRTHEDVPDPYYGGERGFQEVYDILDRSTESLLGHIEATMLR